MYRAKFVLGFSIFLMCLVVSISPFYAQEDYMMLDEEGNEFEILPESYNEDGYPVYNWNGEEYHSI